MLANDFYKGFNGADVGNNSIRDENSPSKNQQCRIVFNAFQDFIGTEIGNDDENDISKDRPKIKEKTSPKTFGDTGLYKSKKNRAYGKGQ